MSIFRGFNTMPLEPNHPLLEKWTAVRVIEDRGLGDEFRHMEPSPRLIEAINITVNRRVVFLMEPRGADVWQSPKRTLEIKTGDCEDFAILKYATLCDLGLALGSMVVMGTIAGRGDHAFCVASGCWVMDNLFNNPISPDKYINFTPVYGFAGAQGFRFGRAGTINEALSKTRG